MESALLGVVLDSSTIITAERKKLTIPKLIEAIETAYGEVDLSTVAGHGCGAGARHLSGQDTGCRSAPHAIRTIDAGRKI